MFRDTHRGYGGYCVSDGRTVVYHSGDTAYFDGFKRDWAEAAAGCGAAADWGLLSG